MVLACYVSRQNGNILCREDSQNFVEWFLIDLVHSKDMIHLPGAFVLNGSGGNAGNWEKLAFVCLRIFGNKWGIFLGKEKRGTPPHAISLLIQLQKT